VEVKMRIHTKREARLALAAAHGLGRKRSLSGKAGALEAVRRMRCIQSDPIDVAGRNHDLTLQSRVSGYSPAQLDALLYKDRKLFEYTCKMLSIMPIEAYPVFHSRRQFHAAQDKAFMRENKAIVKEILDAAESGPIASRHFGGEKKVHWWGMTKVARVALERLWMQGQLVIHHREGGVKFYALADKVVPKRLLDAEPPSDSVSQMAKTLFIAEASRLVSPSRAPEQWYFAGRKSSTVRENLDKLVKSGELFRLDIDGCRVPLYAPEEDRGVWDDPPEIAGDWVRFLAPLDPLLWNRALFREVYGHGYTWEVYKKPHQREHGYYCLPVMFDGDYIGLIEPWFDKKEKALEIRSFHLKDGKVDRKKLKEALSDELDVFAEYLGAGKVLAGKVRL
jgi:uncharacterized protein YcaQ